MQKGTCINCGADDGLHHYKTNQCPVGGREAPFDSPQEWQASTFQKAPSITETEQIVANVLNILEKQFDVDLDHLGMPAVKDIAQQIHHA